MIQPDVDRLELDTIVIVQDQERQQDIGHVENGRHEIKTHTERNRGTWSD